MVQRPGYKTFLLVLGQANLREAAVSARPHLLPKEAQVINWDFFTAGLEEVFGCKLSCTVASLEKAVGGNLVPGIWGPRSELKEGRGNS